MWNCDWEYENQETLRQWYEEKLAGIRPNSIVRKIVCKGCGKVFTPKRSDAVYCCNAGNRSFCLQSSETVSA